MSQDCLDIGSMFKNSDGVLYADALREAWVGVRKDIVRAGLTHFSLKRQSWKGQYRRKLTWLKIEVVVESEWRVKRSSQQAGFNHAKAMNVPFACAISWIAEAY